MKEYHFNELEKALRLLGEAFCIIDGITQQQKIDYELMTPDVRNSKEGEEILDSYLSLEQHMVDLENNIDAIQNVIYK